MRVVVSTLFCVLRFPHQGKVVTVDQLAFFNADTRAGNVPFIENTPPGYENVGVGLLKDSSLMGTFPIPPPPNIPSPSVASINMISTVPRELPVSVDPWIVPRELISTSICDPLQACVKIKRYLPEMVGEKFGKGICFVFELIGSKCRS
jgi:hypothetical protein